MPTGRDIVTGALRELGVLGLGREASGEQASEGLDRLNRWINSLALERAVMQTRVRTVKDLTATTSVYTIGAGGSINLIRPNFIEDASLILDDTVSQPTETPIRVYHDQEWAQISHKTLPGVPEGIYYDRSYQDGLGLLYIYPVPATAVMQLVLYTPKAANTFSNLTALYNIAEGYEELFVMNLAVLLAPRYGKKLDADGVIITQAARSMERLGIVNLQIPEMRPSTPSGLTGGGGYDIMTNRYR